MKVIFSVILVRLALFHFYRNIFVKKEHDISNYVYNSIYLIVKYKITDALSMWHQQ